jgi:rhamnulokinase
MSKFYVACELGAETGRIMLGTLNRTELVVSESSHFANAPISDKGSLHWNIQRLFEAVLEALRGFGEAEEQVDGISCTSWGSDYLLFARDGSLMAPVFHYGDPRTDGMMEKFLAKVPWETVYAETGAQQRPGNTLFQLRAESSRRLGHASHLLPVADGLNFLLSGVPRVELSLASTTQLYNPVEGAWSKRLMEPLKLHPKIFPELVRAGTVLGPLRPELAKEARLEEVQVVASCSHEMAATLSALPFDEGENYAFLRPGTWTTVGTQTAGPRINSVARELNFNNEPGLGSSFWLYKQSVGLWILDECRRFWEQSDRGLDDGMLLHLAGAVPPFESIINPIDPRFLSPGDMPLKIQAYCKETNQTVPRKPGPIFRCVLESLAVHYRKLLKEVEFASGSAITHVYLLGGHGAGNIMLNHFIANAVQLPVTVAPANATALGNILVQAMALGQIDSLQRAHEIVRNSCRLQTIQPQVASWDMPYDRLVALCPA